jgi:hypothetical protein
MDLGELDDFKESLNFLNSAIFKRGNTYLLFEDFYFY